MEEIFEMGEKNILFLLILWLLILSVCWYFTIDGAQYEAGVLLHKYTYGVGIPIIVFKQKDPLNLGRLELEYSHFSFFYKLV